MNSVTRHRFAAGDFVSGAVFAMTLAAALIVAAGAPGHANDRDVYLVRQVATTGVGKTDAGAQRAAEIGGAPAALRRLLKRLTLQRDHARLPVLPARRARALVRGVEVAKARRLPSGGGRSFSGALSYLFDRQKIAAFLNGAGIPWSDRQDAAVLVLPVWRGDTGPVLWDAPNPWRATWERHTPAPGLTPYLLAEGGVADLQAIDGAQAAALSKPRLAAIAKAYDVTQVLVVVAQAGAGGALGIKANLFRLKGGIVTDLKRLDVQAAKPLEAGVERVMAALETRWKRQVVQGVGPTVRTQVLVRFSGIASWTRIRENLAEAPAVRTFRVKHFSAGEATVEIAHVGPVRRVAKQLEALGLRLHQPGLVDGAGHWELKVLNLKKRPSE